jgi:hypothetical protein
MTNGRRLWHWEGVKACSGIATKEIRVDFWASQRKNPVCDFSHTRIGETEVCSGGVKIGEMVANEEGWARIQCCCEVVSPLYAGRGHNVVSPCASDIATPFVGFIQRNVISEC